MLGIVGEQFIGILNLIYCLVLLFNDKKILLQRLRNAKAWRNCAFLEQNLNNGYWEKNIFIIFYF